MPPDDRWPEDSQNPWRNEPEERFGPEYGEPAAPRPGMGPGRKVLIGCLVLVGGTFLLCCGGMIFVVAQFRFEASPQEAVRVTREIVEIEIPEQFRPMGITRVNLIVFRMKGALYQTEEARDLLMIAEINVPPGEMPENVGHDLQRALERQARGHELRIRRSEVREFEIGERKVPFVFAEAVDEQDRSFHQVTGTFPSRGGTAILVIQVQEEDWDEEAVERMIQSIRPAE